MIDIVQWEGERQVGLSPGQTKGFVGGAVVRRPEYSDISKEYIVGIDPPVGEVRGGPGVTVRTVTRIAGASEPSAGVGERVVYGQVTRDVVQTPGSAPAYRVPSAYESGYFRLEPGGLFATMQQQRQYPSTPIDYSRTPVSGLYTYPLFRGAEFVSRSAQRGIEWGIERVPAPEPLKETARGFTGMFTGLPEYFASGISGIEYAAREPEVFRKGIVPAFQQFGAGITTQAMERPYYTVGQAVGLVAMWRGLPRAPKLLDRPRIEPLKLPDFRQPLPKPPLGMEGLEILRLPDRPGVYKPTVIEGVKSIRAGPSAIPEQYRTALERGAAPFSERGVMGIRFGSPGYRPTGAPKPANVFTTGEFKRFIKEEKAVSYVPTFERLKAEPQVQPKVRVMTMEKGYVLPSLRNLQVVRTAPKTSVRLFITPKTTIMTGALSRVQTRPRTQFMTRTAIAPAVRVKTLTQTKIMPSTRTRIQTAIIPEVRVHVATKTATQIKVQPLTKTQTGVMLGVKKMGRRKVSLDLYMGKKRRKGKRKGFRFPELTGVAKPKQVLGGLRL